MTNVKTLSDVLDLDMPELPEEEEEEVVVSSVSMVGRVEVTASDSPFDDEETRMFYERLQDLRAMVPAIYFSEETTGLKPPEESTDSSAEPEPEPEGEEGTEDGDDEKPPEEAVEDDIVVEDFDEDAVD